MCRRLIRRNFAGCGRFANHEAVMTEECEKKAAELGFDLTKQFLTLAFAGIAFVVGLSFNTPGAVSSLMLWLVIGVFGGSVLLGLLFLMRGVSLLSVEKSYNLTRLRCAALPFSKSF